LYHTHGNNPQHHKTMRHFFTACALAIAISGVAQSTQAPAQGRPQPVEPCAGARHQACALAPLPGVGDKLAHQPGLLASARQQLGKGRTDAVAVDARQHRVLLQRHHIHALVRLA
jgi:hypothetical protein